MTRRCGWSCRRASERSAGRCWPSRHPAASRTGRPLGRVARGARLSLCTAVTSWDTTMLSEPLALSLTALLLAALLRLARRPDRRGASRGRGDLRALDLRHGQNNLVLGVLLAGDDAGRSGGGVAPWHRNPEAPARARRRHSTLVCGLAVFSYGRNTEILRYNTAAVLGGRVLVDDDAAAWFVDHGLPLSVPGAGRSPCPPSSCSTTRPSPTGWRIDGLRTYAPVPAQRIPIATITEPHRVDRQRAADLSDPDRADEALLIGITYGGGARGAADSDRHVFIDQESTRGHRLRLAAVGLATAVVVRRRSGGSMRWLVPLLCIGLQWPALTVVWHGSVGELERLGSRLADRHLGRADRAGLGSSCGRRPRHDR